MSGNPFSDEKFIMTDSAIHRILLHCKKCFKITLNANLICHIKDLTNIKLPTFTGSQQKYFIFIFVQPNTQSTQDDTKYRASGHQGIRTKKNLGHWISMACDMLGRNCLLIDPANRLNSYPDTVQQINLFCSRYSFSWFPFGVEFEGRKSKICGITALFFCIQFSNMSIQGILQLRTMIQSEDIRFIENHIVTSVQNHFKIVF